MNTNEELLAEFKNSNEQQRLDLYLQYRDLRDDFENIEGEESRLSQKQSEDLMQVEYKTLIVNKRQSIFTRMKRRCLSFLS